MAKKKQEEAPKGAPAWMATFSDLMNLLLCFFVLLFSMSSIDAAKYELVVNSLKSAFSVLSSGGQTISDGQLIGAGISAMPDYSNYFGDTLSDTEGNEVEDGLNPTVVEGGGTAPGTGGDSSADTNLTAPNSPSNPSDANNQNQNQSQITASQAQQELEKKGLSESEKMAEYIEKLTQQYGIAGDVEVDYNGQFVRLTLNGALLFESGSADIKPTAYRVVDNIGKILESYKESLIEVEGHTDNVPINSVRFPNNNVLSMYRALSVADRLRAVETVPPGNIASSGRGDYAPIADNGSQEGRARNRRVEIKIFNSYYSNL